ncbi:hypothetical protein TNCV_1619191 [Trichonephila clavipes]|nr:hypothetical protein TNCV_1619191 [Trichonephila clavipes]
MRQVNQQFSSILTKIGNDEQRDEMEIALIESRFCTVKEAKARCLQGMFPSWSRRQLRTDFAKFEPQGALRRFKRRYR